MCKIIKSAFVYPKKKPITYKVSSKEVETSKILNKKDFARAKETIKFIKSNEGHFSICYNFMNDIIRQVSE